MDEKLMKKRRQKSRKKRVQIRKLNTEGAGVSDERLLNGTETTQSVSIQGSVMTMGTDVTGGSLLSKNSAAPTLTQSLMSGKANDKMGFQIMDVDMLVPKGELVMMFGEIGSGKSSIFYSMMNEMNTKYQNPYPQLKINGDMFFVSQNPWLLNMSIRDNIILDRPYNKAQFDNAIKYSAMESDLKMFDEGANRILTDGASNLSGGQRTRVALARALYQK
jgi:ABC-type transport system involved in cytochrome bd biosynthesis fused ATPase/permease subunit